MLDVLLKRRSIRKFKETTVEHHLIEQLIKAALLSPSSRNICPWEFVVVTDSELLEELSKSKIHGSAFLKNAPLGIVVLGDEEKSDVWIEDASIASVILHVTAESMGLGSCWIQIRNRQHSESVTSEEYIQELLQIPATKRVQAIIAIGYPDEHKKPHDEQDLQYHKVHENQYGLNWEKREQ
ncbi:hypothetical protein BHU72_13450 [Desulfuribacillus stibiiarsenatis]|uniref:Nitroreductase domain-containing protein n=1 Tax=Desulfuribacillus stibiiarsenatis TaxID=1390249 RepID=A0A1E5L8M8_9FIRM|nr:nitroreductase family protein [Desulfuribacillus stibiiarsenatis]OEH86418.1 hypothetical protein BHU72_13450 [Desulfuribacillus stibiiarsenatis]